MYTYILNNYQQVLERIVKTAKNAGRNPDSIRLVVVTKTKPIEVIQAVLDAGASDLGENYVEEALPKIKEFENSKKIRWHMIGHVQRRKALSVCENFQYLHSLDSVKLAEKLSLNATMMNKPLPVFLEFNVGGEDSKSGWNIWEDGSWEIILPEVEKIFSLSFLHILGVMTIPPYSTNPEESRPYYSRLRKFQEFVINRFQLTSFTELSMGMSGDFEVAIQEGSTCLRIGQAILGPRTV